MQWDHTIRVTDVAIAFATLLGPVLAIQAQTFLERRRALKGRRLNVFYALMRTRATPLAPDAVNALNAVPLEFYGIEEITESYRAFITHINAPPTVPNEAGWAAWGERRVDLLMDLIHKIAQRVGYKFTVAELKSQFYAPQLHQTVEEEQTAIRVGLMKILKGEAGLKIEPFTGAPGAGPVTGGARTVT
jgi:hypothetical protein